MNVLVACEESQRVCMAFREKGHEAFSCDISECSGGHPEWHIQGDVLPLLNGASDDFSCRIEFFTQNGDWHELPWKWDMILAFPPCTNLSSSGQWAYAKGFKDISLLESSVDFFMRFANADCPRIAIENPIGVMSTRFRKPDQIIQPWQFGDNAVKSTCIWLKGLPLLQPLNTDKPDMDYFVWSDIRTGKKKRMQRWMYDIRCISDRKLRAVTASKTFPGIAYAMADQWG